MSLYGLYSDIIGINIQKKMKELTIQPTWIPTQTVRTIRTHTFYFLFK